MKKILLLFIFPLNLYGGVVCVDDNNPSTQNGSSQYPYNSIQSAILNAVGFDTIKVATGTYGRIDNMGKPLVLLGGYQGGTTASYNAGTGGDFVTRLSDPLLTAISGGTDSVGVLLTRFTTDPFLMVLDNFRVSNSLKGIVCDIDVSWPHAENVTISNNIIESNGQAGLITLGGGLFLAGNNNQILNNIIRNNQGGRGPGISGNFTPTDSVLIEGNLVENNTGYDDHGGGIYLGGFVTLTRNTIAGNQLQNSYGWGGGVLILGVAYMSYNIIRNNTCPSYGGAVFVDEGGIAYLDNELIYGNVATFNGTGGAGVALDDGAPGSSYVYMTNCTVVNNYSPGSLGGNAVFVDVNSFCTVKNCIMYGNGDDFSANSASTITVTYTLSQDNPAGAGNFTADPLFADTADEDFHLLSRGGRYEPVSQTWVIDNVHSPAIDAGDSTSAFSNEPSPHGSRINLGCYGNTIFASKSFGTGIDDLSASQFDFKVHPNPTSGKFRLDLRSLKPVNGELMIYNVAGEKVYQSQFGNEELQSGIDVSWLNAGFYSLQILTADFIHSEKIAITNR